MARQTPDPAAYVREHMHPLNGEAWTLVHLRAFAGLPIGARRGIAQSLGVTAPGDPDLLSVRSHDLDALWLGRMRDRGLQAALVQAVRHDQTTVARCQIWTCGSGFLDQTGFRSADGITNAGRWPRAVAEAMVSEMPEAVRVWSRILDVVNHKEIINDARL